MNHFLLRAAILSGAGISGLVSAAPAQAPAALAMLEPGQWELKVRGDQGAARKICVSNPWQLMQIEHPRNSCRRFIVSQNSREVIVTYDCADAGNGRTDLRVETSRLAQIHSQGISESAPFAYSVEARRVGSCG